jgi:Nif-specific regulatory protein
MSVPDRYRRLELLGQGGSGQVWLVEDQYRPGSRFALKESSAGSADRRDALRREFVLLARLHHPGLVEAYELDSSPTDGCPRFTLEYVDGDDLATAVANRGPALFFEMAAEALRVLAFLHDLDLRHRDLKPTNLLVRRRPRLGCRLVLLDLGLASLGDVGELSPGPGPVGTLPYMAPELFEGASPTRRADLYSLGALLYELVHGQPPLLPKDDDLPQYIEAVKAGRRARPALPSGYAAGLSGWLEELLHPDPARRPAGAAEALARLNTACGTSFPRETAASRAARLASDPPPGREKELKRLWSALAPDSGPNVVWLVGSAGFGKTRLLRWLQSEAILRGWEVVATLSHLGDLTTTAIPTEGPPMPSLRDLRERTKAGPVLVLIDEIESADGAVVRMLDRIAREGKAPPLQVVAAVDTGRIVHPLLRRLLDHAAVVPTMHRVDLAPLDEEGIRALAERATGGSDLSQARLGWMTRASEGNPLVAESLLVEGTWERGGERKTARILEHSFEARLDLLSGKARSWLEALAVLGADAPEPVVATLCGLDDRSAREAAEEARFAGLATSRRGRWSPASRIVVDQAMRGLTEPLRAEFNRRAAELLEQSEPAEGLEWRLARLWSAAGERGKVIGFAVQAARRSKDHGDPDETAQRLAFALRHCDRADPRRRELRIQQGASLLAAGRHQAAARAWGAALRLTRAPGERADLLARQAHALTQAGRFRRAEQVAREALELSQTHGLPLQRANALKVVGMVLGRLGREAEALPELEGALRIYRECGEVLLEAETLQVLAACKSRLQLEDAEADFRLAVDLYRKLEHRGSELKSLLGLAVIHTRAARHNEARRLLEDVRRKSVEHGNLDLQETALSKLATLAIEQGQLDTALSLSREALDLARHLADQNREMIDRCRLAEALIGCGRPAEAVELLRQGLDGALAHIEPDMVDYARMLLAHALLETPAADARDAGLLLEKCQDGFRRRRKKRPLLIALVQELERRSVPGAAEPFDPVAAEFDALAKHYGRELEPEVRIRSELARALTLLHQAIPQGALEGARRAAAFSDQAGLPDYAARAQALIGEALEQLGKPAEAAEAFERGNLLLVQAAGRIESPSARRSFLDRPVFRGLRDREPAERTGDDRRLIALYEMIRALNSETDPEALLETILEMALRAVSAERGMILLREEGREEFSVRLARNLEAETEADAERYSRGIVAQAGSGRPILAMDAGEDDRFRDLKSVSMFGIRSLMCVPLRSRGTIIGTVYLDSQKEGRLFTPKDLRFLEAFSDHAALALQNARERAELEIENRRLRDIAETRLRFGNLIGRSPAMQQVFHLIEKVAASDLPVLIQGESGTGKELVARAIHFNGTRKRRVFLSENCAAIPESLLESELFGHVRGAFTGAERDRAGLFEQADGGTLFLDEVGDMSPGMQARLLRALQEGEVRRVGGERSIHVDVRVLAATHRDLNDEVQAGRFREDLLYRLQVLVIYIPPLRERPEDIPVLIDYLLERISRERGREIPRMEEFVRGVLERYEWPGNVRQLENALQRLVLLAGEGPVTRAELETDQDVRATFLGPDSSADQVFSLSAGVREELKRALVAAGGNRERAAKLLGISRATIYRKIKEHGLS